MNWTDRLTSLMLGEGKKQTLKQFMNAPTTPLRLTNIDQESADDAAAKGTTPHSPETDNLFGTRFDARRSSAAKRARTRIVPNVGSMASLKRTSTKGVPSDPTTGPLGRKDGTLAKVLKKVLSKKP